MNRKIYFIIFRFFVISVIAFLGYVIISKIKVKRDIFNKISTIPDFDLLSLNQKRFDRSNLNPKLNTVFIYFNSECDFCQHEALSIRDNLDSFKNIQFIFVSNESIVNIQQFSEMHNLNNTQNISFLHDNNSIFSDCFDATSIPYILIYDKNQKLIKKHKGQLNANGILKAINQND